MVDSIQPVGQGRHLKLHLSKGPCRFDAIFFSVTEDECGITAGSRVDVAFYFQINTFRGNTTLQLQLVDIRPSLTPSRHQAEDLALVARAGGRRPPDCPGGRPASRPPGPAVPYWRVLEQAPAHRAKRRRPSALLRTLAREAACECGGSENFLRAALALEIFRERGLVSLREEGARLVCISTPFRARWT